MKMILLDFGVGFFFALVLFKYTQRNWRRWRHGFEKWQKVKKDLKTLNERHNVK